MPAFETENRAGYYKTYTDNIFVGPAHPVYGVWDRYVSGSMVGGATEYKGATFLTDYTFQYLHQYFRAGEPRFVRLASSNQVIRDSVAPNILDLYLTGSWGQGYFGQTVNGGGFSGEVLGACIELWFAKDRRALTASISYTTPGGAPGAGGQRLNNTEWYDSYPFEKKYQWVRDYNTQVRSAYIQAPCYFDGAKNYKYAYFAYKDVTNLINSQAATILITTGSLLFSTCSAYIDQPGAWNGSAFVITAGPASTPLRNFVPTLDNQALTNRLIFGINPVPLVKGTTGWIDNIGNGQTTITCQTGSTIEGWKYGLYSGIPTKFSCVFRRDHYGQPRDMLEGRVYTQTYNNPSVGGPFDTNDGINFISGSALAGESDNWLTASIYAGTGVEPAYRVNPYGSGLFDKFARASRPWYDDDPRIGT